MGDGIAFHAKISIWRMNNRMIMMPPKRAVRGCLRGMFVKMMEAGTKGSRGEGRARKSDLLGRGANFVGGRMNALNFPI